MNDFLNLPAPQRIQVKVFTSRAGLEKDELISVFHRWIQKKMLSELAIDVADYSHVPDGPGIILIGHEADYAFDEIQGAGLRYVRKKMLPASLVESVALAFRQVLVGSQLLEEDNELDVHFDTSFVEVTFLDRRLYPNNPETEALAVEVLSSIFKTVYNVENAGYSSVYVDSRYPLTIRIDLPVNPSITSLLDALNERVRVNEPAEVTS